MSNMSLIQLPVELLHGLFDYLDTRTILNTIRPVCEELADVTKTYNKLRLDFSLYSNSDLNLIANFIQPENVIYLILEHSNDRELSQVNLFFSLFASQLNRFPRLQSLTLIEISHRLLNRFFEDIITYPLTSLSIILYRQQESETYKIGQLLSTYIRQSGFHNLRLNISNMEKITNYLLEPIQSALQHLTINECTYPEYHVILATCLQLRILIIEKCIHKNRDHSISPTFASRNYPQLTSLTINRCWLPLDDLHLVLSLTPSLTHLKLIAGNLGYSPTLYGHLWQRFIETQLPHLKNFAFAFIYSIKNAYYSLESIISPFRTSFWLNNKRWIVICDYLLKASEVILHTIPVYKKEFEVIIRCDSLSLNNSYCLMNRHLLNHLENIYTEQTTTTVDLSNKEVNNMSARYFATALENNKILTTLKLHHQSMTCEGRRYIIKALENNNTLTTLNFGNNQISSHEAKYFEDLLRVNTTLTTLNLQTNQIGDKGIEPIANVLIQKNRTLKNLSLEQNGISARGASLLANLLENNKTLVTLDLQSNTIGHEGMKYLLDALENNTTLTTLILAYNRIETIGIQHLSDTLSKNTLRFTTLNLSGNSIEIIGAEYLSDALKNNKTLTTLILSYNQIGASGTKHLADALEYNTTLTTIDLRANKIGSSGAKYLSDALQKNKTLTTLSLRGNNIGSLGSEYLANMLQNNMTLTTLTLENNGIGDQGTEHLAKALQNNTTLKTLNLQQNDIGTLGAEHMKTALEKNMTITTLHIRENNSIDVSVLDRIDQLLERNNNKQ